jgi:hypothetical protein
MLGAGIHCNSNVGNAAANLTERGVYQQHQESGRPGHGCLQHAPGGSSGSGSFEQRATAGRMQRLCRRHKDGTAGMRAVT